MRTITQWSLRARLTVLTTAGLALALALAALAFLWVLESTLVNAAGEAARKHAREIAAQIDAVRLPDPIPGTGTESIQVVNDKGRITAASAGADRLIPLLPRDLMRAAARDERARFVDGRPYGIPEPLSVVAVPAAQGRSTVIVAISIASVDESIQVARNTMLVGGPMLLALLAGASWLIVGSTLRPIEAIRRGADTIGYSATPSRRLPLPEADDEVRSLAVTLNGMLARLEGAAARKRAFVSDAAHELRSPLTSIRTQLEVAAAHGAELPELVDDLLADTLRLSRLADDLLALARLDEKGTAPRRPADLAELTRSARNGYPHEPTGYPDVGVSADEPVPVSADAPALRRAIGNLIDNAVRHAESNVRVDVRRSGPWAVLTVTDDGPGIPAHERERVFDRFTRLDDARSRDDGGGGAGLGLAIVREAVRAHGGEVTLEDAEPGLRAVIRLPAR